MDDKKKGHKIELFVIIAAISIMAVCFIHMAVEDNRNSHSQVTVTFTEEVITTAATECSTESNKSQTLVSNISETQTTSSKKSVECTTKAVELPININTADKEELMFLDGIGEAISSKIIRYRSENGNFNNIEEIMNVSGIGIGIFNNISAYIYVENPVYPTEIFEDEPVFHVEPEYEEYDEPEDMLTLEAVAPIELNSADMELLMMLPYVDEDIAGEIIELRDSIFGFSHTYELLYIEKLTQQQVEEILEYVYVEAT